ncbi:ferritin-like domain-containing protein [Daedaleopsis nitida]|nr:ferritin-like domain-containing protein [Daedaleopsis nitida]
MFKTLLATLAVSTVVLSAPAPVTTDVTDKEILRIALTLEHTENAFYTSAMKAYSEQDFVDAGFDPEFRGRFAQIANHEAAHVAYLIGLLGGDAVEPCQYDFPHTEPRSFVAMSTILETIGTSAYIGAAKHISDRSYLTGAGAILAVEARHQAWVSGTVSGGQPWQGSFDVPLPGSGALALAAQFITPESCPLSNGPLPLPVALPSLDLLHQTPARGEPLTVNVVGLAKEPFTAVYFAWMDGMDVLYSDSEGNFPLAGGLLGFHTTVPENLHQGTVLVTIVSSKDQRPSGANMLSGFQVVTIV